MAARYELDGYAFLSEGDRKRAEREKETISYLKAHTDSTDMKALYKIYRISIEKQSFQTIFGLEYLNEIRDRLIGSEIVTADLLEPIPVGKVLVQKQEPEKEISKKADKTAEDIEKLRFQNIVKNFLIAVLAVVIAVMLFVTYRYKYSIFTYFTNYEQKMRDEITDEYKEWEDELSKKEKELNEREKAGSESNSAVTDQNN